ncbi:DUF4913 domain-containing protein [Arthrobacter sp. YD4]|uniref:DUF4913 domain-containing protein n=1 Tax=Arthrobacter sp. YD4 TaxID=3058043 RepID=UPI0025B2E50E|nr:DUF4913 domain-containing protein [Arthrobacter sp. YD4]MDN3935701.1 DUF4913 domain-containing protein [Arthrobacter sp. YD4]
MQIASGGTPGLGSWYQGFGNLVPPFSGWTEPRGSSVWWKDHADHHRSVLLDPRGPFYKCDMPKHRAPAHL